jgi:hypothetical protein
VTAPKKPAKTPPATPPHGTVRRYRLELKLHKAGDGPAPCDRCRGANSERAKTARVNRTAKVRRASLSIVDDVTPDGHTDVSQTSPPADPSESAGGEPQPGAMEVAVDADIEALDPTLRVPFFGTLTALARAAARAIDSPDTPTAARTAASKQLFELLQSLIPRKEGDDTSAVALLLEAHQFGVPPVP